jgi:hypothetical protein
MILHFSCTVAAPHTGQAIASSALSTFTASVRSWLASFNAVTRIATPDAWQLYYLINREIVTNPFRLIAPLREVRG